MGSERRLVLVYNADSGRLNALLDMAHKLFSPQTYACDLCAITHGVFREREAWGQFVDSLPLPVDYLHRDEFHERYPELTGEPLPLVLLLEGEQPRILLDARGISGLDTLEDLGRAIRSGLEHSAPDALGD